MAAISAEEKLRRNKIIESVLGTNAMEGLTPDAATLAIMRRYESGELSMEEFSAEMDAYGHELVRRIRPLAVA